MTTTSGTTLFSLDVDDIIEEALDNVKGDPTNGAEQARARRSLNLLLIELQNKNIPLNKIGNATVTLLASTQTYTLDGDVSDVLEVTLKTISSGTEYPLDRWGEKQWHTIPNKDTEQRPTLFSTDRNTDYVDIKFWPVPDVSSTYTAELLVAKRIEDVTASYQRVDLPYRYLPLLVIWLSHKLAFKREGLTPQEKMDIKMELDTIMVDTFDEDGERVDFYVVPGGISGR